MVVCMYTYVICLRTSNVCVNFRLNDLKEEATAFVHPPITTDKLYLVTTAY